MKNGLGQRANVASGALVLAMGCGSRTPLFDAVPAPPPATVVVTDLPCSTDAACNDGIPCTLDACDPTAHVCTRDLRDAMCDDGLYCDGDERCDIRAGCVSAPSPRDCADAIECT